MRIYDSAVLRIIKSNLVVELTLEQLYELSQAIEDYIEEVEKIESRNNKTRRK